MKRWIMLAALGSLLGGCTGDTQMLAHDLGDSITHKLLDSVLGFLFPSDTGDSAQRAAPESPGDVDPS